MRTRSCLLPGLFAVAFSAFSIGCGAGTAPNDAPILDNVESPLVVAEEHGVYRVPVTVFFHDHDREVITHVRYRMVPSLDRVIAIEVPNPTRESAEVTLEIPAAACGDKDTHALEISVIDGRGAESHPIGRVLTLR